MIRFCYRSAGISPVEINVVETVEDLDGFRSFIRNNRAAVGYDMETTGLDIYAPGFRPRLAQFGNANESWVIPVDVEWDGYDPQFAADVVGALRYVRKIIAQNGTFDLLVMDKHLGLPAEETFPKLLDSQVLAKLIDPRPAEAGGVGHSLEELTTHYLCRFTGEKVKGSIKELAKTYKTTKALIWRRVDLWDWRFLLYSGMDPILAFRLAQTLHRRVPQSAKPLIPFEHEVTYICALMTRNGFLLDEPYTRGLSEELREQEAKWNAVAASYGVENVNAVQQCIDGMRRAHAGFKPSTTAKGNEGLDKQLLAEWIGKGSKLAEAIKEAKKAGKWRKTWVDTFLAEMDEQGRCHASINTLQARTGRMSITGIPAQTLPSGDWMIRRCFVADEGHVMSSVDYQAQELRVLAALSGDETMKRAFAEDADLHQITADASGVPRKVGKTVNFAYVYGSGPKNIAESCGISVETAKKVIAGFETAYPKVKKLSQELQRKARRYGYITTPSGRRLPVDKERPYSALNYLVQSTSRDVTCRGLVRMHRAGYTPYLRLPIHDEVVASLPADKAVWGAERIGELMAEEMRGVWIGTDPEVGKQSWGSLYGATT